MKKHIAALLMGGAIAAGSIIGLTGCGGDDGIKLTVWGSAAQQDTLKEMVEEFKAANPDTKYNIKVGIGEEDMAYSNVSKDPSAAADVYAYANDQLIPLLRVGALAKLGGTFLETVKAENSAESVEAATLDIGSEKDGIYGYPFASDNGYFMYYDKSVVSDEQAATLEGIIAACEGANKKIAWALDVPWYTAGWFFAYDCGYDVEYNDKLVETKVEIDFNDEVKGIKASKAMAKLTSSKAFAGKGTSDSTIITGFTTHQTAVAVSGTWNALKIKDILGDDYGVCKLPTVDVDGTPTQLSSFNGYKLFGVNPHSSNLVEAHRLAAFLSNGNMQQKRFDKHLIGPTNITVANNSDVKNDATFAALTAQSAFAVPQTSVPSNFWEPLKNYALNIIDDLVSEEGGGGKLSYKTQLDKMVNLIKGSVTA